MREEIDKLTGHAHKIVIEPLGSGKRIPTLVVEGEESIGEELTKGPGRHPVLGGTEKPGRPLELLAPRVGFDNNFAGLVCSVPDEAAGDLGKFPGEFTGQSTVE